MSSDPWESNDPARRVVELAAGLKPYYRRYEAERDSRAVFAYTYFNLTYDLAEWLADDAAAFDDSNWVADLAVAFGARYTTAMDAIDEWQAEHAPDAAVEDSLYQRVARPWADVYRAICREHSTVLEDLVFAMGAHITYDLPYALLEVGTETDHLADYHRMNDVLASRTDAIQDVVTNRYHRVLARLDRIAGGADEAFTDYQIRIGRSMAWYNAMRLQSPLSRSQAEGSIERTTFYLIESVRLENSRLLRLGYRLYSTLVSLARRWPGPTPESTERTAARESRW